MIKTYSRIDWENEPSTKTPLNETNLNKMDAALNEIDNRVVEMDTTKANQGAVNGLVSSVEYDEATGIITVTKYDGTKTTLDTNLEKLAVNFDYNETTQKLIVIHDDGTTQEVDLSSLITEYEFENSETVSTTVTNGKVKAEVINGSITGEKLQPNYLANITTQANEAKMAAASASTDAQRAEDAADRAESIVGIDYATTEKAGIVMLDGKTIIVGLNGLIKANVIRYGEEELIDDVTDLDSNVMYCQISNGTIVKAWIGVEGVAKPLSVGGSPTPMYSISAWAATLEMEYATLDEIPLSDMNLLMNRHVSADYFVEWYKTDNSMLEQFLASDVAMECIGRWDYICDKLFAIPSAKSALLASDKWEYILKDKVPAMTSNTTPSGTVIFNSYRSDAYMPYFAFNGNNEQGWLPNSSSAFNSSYIGYEFTNPTSIIKVRGYMKSSTTQEYKAVFKLQGSNDGSTWNNIKSVEITNSNEEYLFDIDICPYYLKYRMLMVSNKPGSVTSGNGYSFQFYGRALNVSVPKMTSNTEPYGEASASSTWTSAPRPAFHAFDGNMPSASTGAGYWFTTMSAGNKQWLEYEFPQNVCVKMVEGYTDPYYRLNTSFDVEAFVNEWAKIGEVKYTGTSTADAFYYISSHVNEDGVSANRYRFVTNDVTATSVALGKAQFYGVDYSELTSIPLTLTIEGAKGDDITITNASGEIVSNVIFGAEETSKEVTIDIVAGAEYTFTSSVAKATDGSGDNYFKTIVLSAETTNVKVMPNAALYWYGNECVDVTNGWTFNRRYESNGYYTEANKYVSAKNTDNLQMTYPGSGGKNSGVWRPSIKLDLTEYATMKSEVICKSCILDNNAILDVSNSQYTGDGTIVKSNLANAIPSGHGDGKHILSLDISSLNAEYYTSVASIDMQEGTTNRYIQIKRAWLE